MKKILLTSLVIFSFLVSSAQRQRQGIGIRLGDPSGITYKKYLPKGHAVEFGLGSTGPAWHNAYYRNSFESRGVYDNYKYRSHRVNSALYIQGRYLLHTEIYVQDLEGKWDWYWGLGGMLKFAKIRYSYLDADPPYDQTDIYNDIDFGPEGIVGMEYTFQDVPLTVVAEVSLMLELVDRITFQPFGAAGLRYRF
jgi:hypothetical protein